MEVSQAVAEMCPPAHEKSRTNIFYNNVDQNFFLFFFNFWGLSFLLAIQEQKCSLFPS